MNRLVPLLALALGCATPPPAPAPLPRAVIEAHPRDVHALAFAPDGLLLASAGGGSVPGVDEVTLWEKSTGLRRKSFTDLKGSAVALAFSPDGTLLAVGGADGRIALRETGSGKERISFAGRAGRIACLSFSFDGTALVSVVHAEGGADVEVCRWDVKMGAPRATWTVAAVPPIALSPDGGTLAWSAGGEAPGIRVLDLETKVERLLSRIGVGPGDSLVYSPDGKWLAAVHRENWSPLPNRCPYLYLVDAQSGKIRLRSPRPFDARGGLALSHDARLLARGVDDGLQLWDLKSLELRVTADGSAQKTAGAELLLFSPDDQTLVSTDRRGRLLFWDVPRLLELRREAGGSPRSR